MIGKDAGAQGFQNGMIKTPGRCDLLPGSVQAV